MNANSPVGGRSPRSGPSPESARLALTACADKASRFATRHVTKVCCTTLAGLATALTNEWISDSFTEPAFDYFYSRSVQKGCWNETLEFTSSYYEYSPAPLFIHWVLAGSVIHASCVIYNKFASKQEAT